MNETTSKLGDGDPRIVLPRLEVMGAFAAAAAVFFGIIFSVSSAIMSRPRDVRLSVHETQTPAKPPQGIALESDRVSRLQ